MDVEVLDRAYNNLLNLLTQLDPAEYEVIEPLLNTVYTYTYYELLELSEREEIDEETIIYTLLKNFVSLTLPELIDSFTLQPDYVELFGDVILELNLYPNVINYALPDKTGILTYLVLHVINLYNLPIEYWSVVVRKAVEIGIGVAEINAILATYVYIAMILGKPEPEVLNQFGKYLIEMCLTEYQVYAYELISHYSIRLNLLMISDVIYELGRRAMTIGSYVNSDIIFNIIFYIFLDVEPIKKALNRLKNVGLMRESDVRYILKKIEFFYYKNIKNFSLIRELYEEYKEIDVEYLLAFVPRNLKKDIESRLRNDPILAIGSNFKSLIVFFYNIYDQLLLQYDLASKTTTVLTIISESHIEYERIPRRDYPFVTIHYYLKANEKEIYNILSSIGV